MSIYNINDHIQKELYNKYGGSERKKTVLLDDGNTYMLKMSDPIREKNGRLSYINNAYSEYIACKIAKSMNLPVQDVILGQYKYKGKNEETHIRPACLCKDLTNNNNLKLIEFDKLSLSDYEVDTRKITFKQQNQFINSIKNINNEQLKDFYYNVFIFDAFVGNTDRHNGNIAILTTQDESISTICPIFDCGSSLLPLINENDIDNINTQNIFLSICSVITDNNKKVNYTDYLINIENSDIDSALKRIMPQINLNKINEIIDSIECLNGNRKKLYKDFLHTRYSYILIPALERITGIKTLNYNTIKTIDDKTLYDFYRKNIKQINDLPQFKPENILINNKNINIMRLGKKYAIILNNKGYADTLINIRSNNDDIRKCIVQLNAYDKNIINITNLQSKQEIDDYER